MEEEITINHLAKTMQDIYKPTLEEELFKDIISAFYLQGTDSIIVEKIIIGLYNSLPSHQLSLGEIIKCFDSIYDGSEKPSTGVKNLEEYLKKNYDTKTSLTVVRELNKAILSYDNNKIYKLEVATDKFVVMNYRKKEVQFQNIQTKKGGNTLVDFTRVLLCYPTNIIIHDNPISDIGRTFSISWETDNKGYFHTKSMNIPEIEEYLVTHGYVLNRKYFKDIVTSIIQIAIENNLVTWKTEIETPGFYYNPEKNNLDIIGYELKDYTISQLNKSLDLIEELQGFFKGHESKLATSLKHGLIAPLGFAKKQMGQPLELLIPYLYHFGKGGSGKTTIARIGLYFYGEPNSDNDIGGSEFDTVPRIGGQISKSTFGLVVNEPGNVFNKNSCVETLKTCVERTNARRKYEGKQLTTILALATVSFASNSALPNVEGLSRRFVQLLYSHSEKKSDEEKEEFMRHFRMNDPEFCLFNNLKYLAYFAVSEIMQDIDLLKLNWKDLSNALIFRAYADCGRTCPGWLTEFAESVSLDDIDDEETEEIRMFFLEEINKQNKNVRVYSADGYQQEERGLYDAVKESDDFRDRVFNVLNERLIPYMILHTNKSNKDYVCFTSGLKSALHKANHACYNVKSIAELLGWQYKTVKLPKPTMCMVVSFNKFIKFLYPDLDEEE